MLQDPEVGEGAGLLSMEVEVGAHTWGSWPCLQAPATVEAGAAAGMAQVGEAQAAMTQAAEAPQQPRVVGQQGVPALVVPARHAHPQEGTGTCVLEGRQQRAREGERERQQ